MMIYLNVLMLLVLIAILVFWAYSVATYDWSKFEEDSKDDDFLKPYEERKEK
jgi:hypothetical protein